MLDHSSTEPSCRSPARRPAAMPGGPRQARLRAGRPAPCARCGLRPLLRCTAPLSPKRIAAPSSPQGFPEVLGFLVPGGFGGLVGRLNRPGSAAGTDPAVAPSPRVLSTEVPGVGKRPSTRFLIDNVGLGGQNFKEKKFGNKSSSSSSCSSEYVVTCE